MDRKPAFEEFVQTMTTQETAAALEKEVAKAFVGSKTAIRLAVTGLLGSLHVLIEDIPGVGKTTLALALSRAAGLSFSRIQFTPDMLPGDVLGMNVWDQGLHDFTWKEGPVHAQFILADELNRTSPRTQAAFLEAMQEGKITVDGKTRNLPSPFFMMGTQNPQAFTGTFPLPEAELDRFGLSFKIGYPNQEDETEILRRRDNGEDPLAAVREVAGAQEIENARKEVSRVHISEAVREYLIHMARDTRRNDNIRLGASPRASLFLQQAAKAHAAIEGRAFVMPEDAEAVAAAVLAHRIQLSSKARIARMSETACIAELCAAIPKPTGL